jgi:superfamily II DNA/RNA helicase
MVVMALSDYMNVTCHACIGGTSVDGDIKRLESGVQIVVGTPGRVFMLLDRSVLRKSSTFDNCLEFSMMNFFRYKEYENAGLR